MNLQRNFCYDQTSGTLSRILISFMTLYGVLKDIGVPEKAGNGVKVFLGHPLKNLNETFSGSFQRPCKFTI